MTAQRMVTMRVANMVPDMEYNLNQSQQSLARGAAAGDHRLAGQPALR